MRAVTLEQFQQPYRVKEVPEPAPGPDEVLLKVLATGVCGTDVKIWKGDLPNTPTPLIPGHEIAAVVVEAASDADGPPVGTQVVVLHHLFCGECPRCRARSGNLCDNLRGRVGFDHDGGFAEYLKVPAKNVLPIPAGINPTTACVIPDAVATVWRAVRHIGQVRPGEGVAVIGAGGLGLAACQIALHQGADVLAIDVSEAKLAQARALGIPHTALAADAREALAALPNGEASVVIDCAGAPAAVELSVTLMPKAGRLVQVGYSMASTIKAFAPDVALKEQVIRGCRACSVEDLREALDAVASGAVTPAVGELRPLDEAAEAIDTLVAGEAMGRQVLVLDESAYP